MTRLHLYKKPVWTCQATGKSGLTYEEALAGERQQEEALNRMQPPLQKRILSLVQFSLTPRLDQLVDDVFNGIKSTFVPDEEILLQDGHRK